MKKSDCREAALIEKDIFKKAAWSEQDFEDTLDLSYAFYVTAKRSGRLLGICGLRNLGGDGYISNVSVIANERGKGIAFGMLKYLMEYTAKVGVEAYTLEVRSKNRAARALYTKLGFEDEGIRKDFYDDPRDDAVLMWKRKGNI
ncbi:MAG: ribosomal protein S18-alanine N-acetyltransferase [Lachnospiraceae bacterium]|nr:ribosomal protein S18-alanine N-acetyltransferase [Lachnospiraceae bacterium]